MAHAKSAPRKRPGRVAEPPGNARRLLLDTHVWLWWQTDDRRLGARARQAIANAVEVRFSAASAWEIAIKIACGKLKLPSHADIELALERNGFQSLSIDIAHARAAGALPPLHGDPFDRMLIAQARHEGLTIVTADEALSKYAVAVMRATA